MSTPRITLAGLGLLAGAVLLFAPRGEDGRAPGATAPASSAASKRVVTRTTPADEAKPSGGSGVLRGVEASWSAEDRSALALEDEARANQAYEDRLEANLTLLENRADAAEAAGDLAYAYADALRARADSMLRAD